MTNEANDTQEEKPQPYLVEEEFTLVNKGPDLFFEFNKELHGTRNQVVFIERTLAPGDNAQMAPRSITINLACIDCMGGCERPDADLYASIDDDFWIVGEDGCALGSHLKKQAPASVGNDDEEFRDPAVVGAVLALYDTPLLEHLKTLVSKECRPFNPAKILILGKTTDFYEYLAPEHGAFDAPGSDAMAPCVRLDVRKTTVNHSGCKPQRSVLSIVGETSSTRLGRFDFTSFHPGLEDLWDCPPHQIWSRALTRYRSKMVVLRPGE